MGRLRVVVLLVLVCSVMPVGAAAAREPVGVVNDTPPSVVGTPRYDTRVQADVGQWTPTPTTYRYQWLLDGERIVGATGPSYVPRLGDLGHELAVRVEASAEGHEPAKADSAGVTVRRAVFTDVGRPRLDGVARFGRTLRFDGLAARPRPASYSFRWLRDGRGIKGATGRARTLGLADFDHRIALRVTARRAGYAPVTVTSPARVVGHRTGVRHAVTYHVETRGRITASVATFKRLAQATFDDPRGWRGGGVAFRRVARGGDFTLVLAEASWLPRFSSGCSAEWSCRVGRYVVINQTRWQHASPMWNQRSRSLRDYRHMVVNHETGHWLGHGHRGCPGKGALAPVMQTQSKGLAGCRPNPFPVASEWQRAWRR